MKAVTTSHVTSSPTGVDPLAPGQPDPIPPGRSRLSKGMTRAGRAALSVAVLVAAGLLWEIVAIRVATPFFPPLSDILVRTRDLWFSGDASRLFITDQLIGLLEPSLRRFVPAFAAATVAGTALGLAIGLMPRFSEVVYPVVHFLRSIPSAAKLPLFIVLLGVGDTMMVWLIAVTVAFPLVINVVDGVRGVEPVLLDTVRSFRISRYRRLRSVILPSTMPKLFAGLRIATMVAFGTMIVAEMYSSSDGIGYFVLYAQRRFLLLDMWAGVILLGVMGWGLNSLLSSLEGHVLKWHAGSKRKVE